MVEQQLRNPLTHVISKQAAIAGFALVVLILLTLALYWPGLGGPLFLDDAPNLMSLGDGGGITDFDSLRAFVFGNNSGPLGRPVAMLSFLIDAQDWPPVVPAMKYTNLMLHLICGLLFGWLSLLLFRYLQLAEEKAAALACLCAFIWLVNPLNLSTTLYVVQRMTQLMTCFGLAALLLFCKGLEISNSNQTRSILLQSLALLPFGLLALFSKENGALVLLVMIALRFTVYQDVRPSKLVIYWQGIALYLPVFLMVIFLLYRFVTGVEGFEYRSFSLWERALTEPRILINYLAKFVVPGIGSYGLFNDNFLVSIGLFTPITTVLSLLFWGALIAAAIHLRQKQAVFSLAVFWFLAMHLIESTFLPLELYFEHRNYMAIMGPVFALVFYLHKFLSSTQQRTSQALIVVCGIVLIAQAVTTRLEAEYWGSNNVYAHWAEGNPGSARAQSQYAEALQISGYLPEALVAVDATLRLYPDAAGLLLQSWNLQCASGANPSLRLRDIANSPELNNHYLNINVQLSKVLENLVAESCAVEQGNELEDLAAVIERILLLPKTARVRANLHINYSNLYAAMGDLNGTLIQLRRAYDYQPIPLYPIRQAQIAASAGNFDDAMIFLQRARETGSESNPLRPAQIEEIEALARQIEAMRQIRPAN